MSGHQFDPFCFCAECDETYDAQRKVREVLQSLQTIAHDLDDNCHCGPCNAAGCVRMRYEQVIT